ncbi:methyltransferase, FxLD system [Streptomyces sp. TN58]|uniref:methyltransferase, FxLD system n=1 Tax=Streptomyces sp. TN58 TaxID=234612 RepID=UPI00095091E0|nr:methyltransferase, FxLD system [Streptomyces sp. TN58]APU42956.1 methyltransferase, FxLD system [Streptomyces sp. TN58]
MSTTHTAQDWHAHYEAGRDFRPLSATEKTILTEHLALPEGAEEARALDVACGTGELARFLAAAGYQVDAVDWAQSAVDKTSASSAGVRCHHLDLTSGDLSALAPAGSGGYRLITMRRALAHLPDRTRTVAELAALLDEDGVLCVITPHAGRHPEELRGICLDDAEIDQLCDGWQHNERFEAEGSTILVLRSPRTAPVTYSEKRTPKPAAMAGVAVVVTNECGQVLLGWNSSRGMWDLPAGKVEPGEAFEATAVRELAEEAGLHARLEAVLLLGTLCDSTHGFTRVTEIARLADYTGEPAAREPELISRWEWHTPSALRHLPQPLFTASAQALNTVWPGLLPHVPPAHHTPRPAGGAALTFGEPATAVRLRKQLVRDLTAAGWTDTPELRAAFTAVPRHAFLPEQPLGRAYANEAVATVVDEDTGRPMSSVSQPEMQAVMLSRAGLQPGASVLEIGGGGYNASLIAELVGESGSVVCVEIDPYVHGRSVRFLAETGYAERVQAVLGDGTHGAPGHLVPADGFDAIIVTVASNDVPWQWTGQLAEDGLLVVPLRIGGFTRAVGLRKQGPVLVSTAISPCGFVPMQGAGRWDETPAWIGDTGYGIRWEDTSPAPLDGLDRALAAGGVELWTGVTVRAGETLEDLQLWLATSLRGFCRMEGDPDRPGPVRLPKRSGAEAVVWGRSLACLMTERREDDEAQGAKRWEFGVQGFGPDGKAAADALAAAVRVWDQELRGRAVPRLTVVPAGTPDPGLPAGDVVKKTDRRIVVSWPGRDEADSVDGTR